MLQMPFHLLNCVDGKFVHIPYMMCFSVIILSLIDTPYIVLALRLYGTYDLKRRRLQKQVSYPKYNQV